GFTLIELIVVLMILVGLAGVIVPAVTDMVQRTHTSTSASNLSELANAVQRYETQFLSYPNNFDALKADLTDAAVTNFILLDPALTSGTLLANVGLTTDTFGALTNAGITNVAVIPNTATSATFTTGVPTPLAATSNLLGLSTTVQQNLGLEPLGTAIAGKYVLLGVGQATTMIGKTMTAAPVHFPDTGAVNPNAVYQRFLAIFQITNSAGVALDRAKFVGF